MSKKLKIKLVKSVIGSTASQKACIKGLGLKHLNSEAVVADTKENMGMINKTRHLVSVTEE